jgi:formylglycine-generating enzyme required for sulfatase activity
MRHMLFVATWIALCSAHAPPGTNAQELENSIGLKMIEIPAGSFMMGGVGYPAREVAVANPFYIGIFEVTNAQWRLVMGDCPSHWKDDDRPVENVTWEDAVRFCVCLSGLREERRAGRVYRLPTDVEWEYACRAGSKTLYSFGDDDLDLTLYAWFGNNSGARPIDAEAVHANSYDGFRFESDKYFARLSVINCSTHSVGTKRPNAWGLYDTHGNVQEWCNGVATFDRKDKAEIMYHTRGGSWASPCVMCRSGLRGFAPSTDRRNTCGFRIAMNVLWVGESQPED